MMLFIYLFLFVVYFHSFYLNLIYAENCRISNRIFVPPFFPFGDCRWVYGKCFSEDKVLIWKIILSTRWNKEFDEIYYIWPEKSLFSHVLKWYYLYFIFTRKDIDIHPDTLILVHRLVRLLVLVSIWGYYLNCIGICFRA